MLALSRLMETATRWQCVYLGTGDTADGIMENPENMALFDDTYMWYPVTSDAGLADTGSALTIDPRLFLREGMTLQLLPLFSQDSSTALMQVWGYSLNRRVEDGLAGVDVESPQPRIIPQKNSLTSDVCLGLPYNMARDDAGNPRTVPSTSKDELITLDASLTIGKYAVPDINGTSWVCGVKHTFNAEGHEAFFINVPVLSSGCTMMILARFLRAPQG